MEVPSILLNRILTEAAKKNSSSLHLAVGSLPMMRIDNELVPAENEDIISTEILEKIISSLITEEEKEKLKTDKEIVLVKDSASGFRFRVNIYYQKNLLAVSLHYISSVVKSLGELKFPKEINNLIKLNSGLIIVAGPHSSGKSATAASLVEDINKNFKKNIITIEDPIEFLFVGKKSMISQRQVGRDVKSVVAGMEYCLDEDADIVYLAEIKKDFDKVVPLILELAAGNSLVIMEMNANSSIRALEKVLNSFSDKVSPEAARFNLADVLSAVIVQRLLPKRGGGLALAAEILFASGSVKSLIREGKIYQLESVIQTSKREGMVSMDRAVEELVAGGEVKKEDAEALRL